jgi:peptidoglycan/LPS O-acetylase OafA/YrhL
VAWKVFALRHVELNDLGVSAFKAGPWLHPLPNFMDQLAIGMALAVISVHGLGERAQGIVARAWPWWLLAAVVYWALCQTVGEARTHVSTGTWLMRHELHAVVATAILLPAVFGSERGGPIRRVLAWRPLLYVGLISYGVYLWNNAVLIKLNTALGGWMTDTLDLQPNGRFAVLLVVGIAGTVAIGTVSYYAFERPMLSLKRLVPSGPRETPPAEAIAEPAPAAPVTVR